jgi:hypothetical protein
MDRLPQTRYEMPDNVRRFQALGSGKLAGVVTGVLAVAALVLLVIAVISHHMRQPGSNDRAYSPSYSPSYSVVCKPNNAAPSSYGSGSKAGSSHSGTTTYYPPTCHTGQRLVYVSTGTCTWVSTPAECSDAPEPTQPGPSFGEVVAPFIPWWYLFAGLALGLWLVTTLWALLGLQLEREGRAALAASLTEADEQAKNRVYTITSLRLWKPWIVTKKRQPVLTLVCEPYDDLGTVVTIETHPANVSWTQSWDEAGVVVFPDAQYDNWTGELERGQRMVVMTPSNQWGLTEQLPGDVCGLKDVYALVASVRRINEL